LSLGGSTDKTSKKTYTNETIQKTQYKQYKNTVQTIQKTQYKQYQTVLEKIRGKNRHEEQKIT
jgi:hypothetical protein